MYAPKTMLYIPDGNRRWGRQNSASVATSHSIGLTQQHRILREAAFESGVQCFVTIWATELNLTRRQPDEVAHLFSLFKAEAAYFASSHGNVRFRSIGNWHPYTSDPEMQEIVSLAEMSTNLREPRVFWLLFGYSGLTDIVYAANGVAHADLDRPANKDDFRSHLMSRGIPDIDLVIRTGVEGDPHNSDAILAWQSANAQMIFSPKYAPEFGQADLLEAFRDFEARPRRMGGDGSSVAR